MTEFEHTNRLIHEKSPYLLQHAHNPVDWFPWGQEAFLQAKDQDKPIFLSIGYATCHWCHVMEKESFENGPISKLLNDSFINIKVDREELPEIDGLYMEFAQAIMPGGGGWPLNVLLTPELQPFFATTYIPPDSGKGYIGFAELIVRLQELWQDPEEREKLIEQANQIIEVFTKEAVITGTELPEKEEIFNCAELLFHMADPVYGGIKGEPKFPMGYHSCFLMSVAKLMGDSRALFCVELTLDMMHRGGIYDHLGGGFSRYCTDGKWQIPHFEKMLYDNAILARAYVEAWMYTKKPFYREVAEDVFRYLLSDMQSPEGAFYSAEDADSSGKEGLFYTWTQEEIRAVLGQTESNLIFDFYGVTKQGNFEGRSILHVRQNEEEFAERRKLDLQKFKNMLQTCREKLKNERDLRERPFKDDKILSSWNGLLIHSLALAGRAFNNRSYLKSARGIADFIYKNLWKDGHLLRRYRDSEARFTAGLDEYAFLIHGLLTLFEVDGDMKWLKWAIELSEILEFEFKAEGGAFYLTDGKDPSIVLRRAEFYDGAEPSGNGIHCENLLRFYQITFDQTYLRQAEDILKAAKTHIEHHPAGCCYSLIALQRYYDRHAGSIVISLNERLEHEDDLRTLLFQRFIPHHVIVWRRPNDNSIFEIAPHLKEMSPLDDKTTVYICQKGECKKPLNEWSEIEAALSSL